MQRWLKLPDGRFIDAARVAYIGKVESFIRMDEDGNDMGTGYSVNIGTAFEKATQINVVGGKDEVFAVLKSILGVAAAPPAA